MFCQYIRCGIVLCLFLLTGHLFCKASEVHGTIQLHPKADFDVVTSRTDSSYDIRNSNTNEFYIKAAAYTGGDSAVAIATDGTQVEISLDYRLAGPGSVLDEKQAIHLALQSPEDITWYPDAINRPGYTTYGYHGQFSPKEMSFSPPVVFNFYDGDTLVGTSGKVPIRELHFNGKPLLALHLSSVELNAQRIRLEVQGGFTREDKFLIASDANPLKKPEIGMGSEIVFIANSDPGTAVPMEMYFPTIGPHVITFAKGFECNDLRIDGTHILSNSAHVNTKIFRIPTKWYHLFETSYTPTNVSFELTFDDPTTYIYNVRIAGGTRFLDLLEDRLSRLATEDRLKKALTDLSSDRVAQLSFPLSEFAEQPVWYPLTLDEFGRLTAPSEQRDSLLRTLSARRSSVSAMELPIISGAYPLVVTGEFAPADGTPLGSYDGDLVMSGTNLDLAHIPIRYELYDPIGSAKQTFGGVTVALLTSYLGWALFDRGRKLKESARAEAAARLVCLRDHYADLLDLQRRISTKGKTGELQWLDVEPDVRWLLRRKLQNALTPQSWKSLQIAIATRNAQAVYQAFNEEMAYVQQGPTSAT